MISGPKKLRRKRFTHPFLLGVADFLNPAKRQNPYRPATPHHALYCLGLTYSRDSQSHEPFAPVEAFIDFSDTVLRALNFPVDPPHTLHDA